MMTLDIPVGHPRFVMVVAHGLTGDRVGPSELLAKWTQQLADERIASARFDFRGSGDSSGWFEETSLGSMRDDLHAVVEWIQSEFDAPLILAGISVGAVPIALSLTEMRDAIGVVLLSTDLREGLAHFPGLISTPFRNGEFHIPRRFAVERGKAEPRKALRVAIESGCRACLIYGTADEAVRESVHELEALGVTLIPIEETDHLFGSVEARDQLSKRTIEFLAKLA